MNLAYAVKRAPSSESTLGPGGFFFLEDDSLLGSLNCPPECGCACPGGTAVSGLPT